MDLRRGARLCDELPDQDVALKQQSEKDPRPACALSIAGSDSGGGAGLQADLKTFAAHRVHGLTAVAALTAQNTREVSAIHAPPPAFLAAQLEAVFADFRVGAVKIGMLATRELIETVAQALDRHAAINIVLDPVMIASSGAALLEADAVDAMKRWLLPRADVLTPNLPEAAALLGVASIARGDMREAAAALHAMGPGNVLLKGGHLAGGELVDVFHDGREFREFVHPRLELEGHGTGCTLSSAIAANMVLGFDVPVACERACDYVHGALRSAYRPGLGPVAVLDHFWNTVTPA
jgi:hydroxymethylpyrimidine/phosphomethylpyrimidine kinase